MTKVTVERVRSEAQRIRASKVLECVYAREKRWLDPRSARVPKEDLDRDDCTWLLAEVSGTACGTTRLRYQPPDDLVAEYTAELVDPSFDVERFLEDAVLAEVGRFAVVASERSQWRIAAALMRGTVQEARARGITHIVTDVFEGEIHSPYEFHRRVLGFELVAHHTVGELRHEGRRATLVLDLERAVDRSRRRRGWIDRFIFESSPEP